VAFTCNERVSVIFLIQSASAESCLSDRTFRLPNCDVCFLYCRFKVRVSKCLSCFIWIFGHFCPSRRTGVYWNNRQGVQPQLKQVKLWLSRFLSSGTWRRAVFQINTNAVQQSRKVSVRIFRSYVQSEVIVSNWYAMNKKQSSKLMWL
jgi:hypothetical protein